MTEKRFFCVAGVTTLVLLTLIVGGLELFTRRVLVPNDDIATKLRLVKQNSRSIEILGLGDSHAGNGLNLPGPNFFNWGRGSDTLPIQYFKLKYAVSHALPLKTLVLQYDFHQFSYYRAHPGETINGYADLIVEPVDPRLGRYRQSGSIDQIVRLVSLSENYAPILFKAVADWVSGRLHPGSVFSNGGVVSKTRSNARWIDLAPERRAREARDRADTQIYQGELVNQGLLSYFYKMLDIAQERQLQVILVRYPLSNEYLARIKPAVDRDFDDLATMVTSRYHVKILDYRRVFEARQELFQDQDHLNGLGAVELGKLIVKEIKETS